ncbi:gastrokine-1-like [Passer montanus]|uniref:gastrokine-1-like n=1 Tax=Passer montanus TaxID=9160 RepID=UPI0019609802|nr:gastrokine-1-like [Passer montanus]
MTLSSQTREVIIEQRSEQFSWKTIWNYNSGIIATKVVQERTCYISTMNRNEMPTFDALIRYASENKNQVGLGRPTKKITFVTNGLVNNLMSYGAAFSTNIPQFLAYSNQPLVHNQVHIGPKHHCKFTGNLCSASDDHCFPFKSDSSIH